MSRLTPATTDTTKLITRRERAGGNPTAAAGSTPRLSETPSCVSNGMSTAGGKARTAPYAHRAQCQAIRGAAGVEPTMGGVKHSLEEDPGVAGSTNDPDTSVGFHARVAPIPHSSKGQRSAMTQPQLSIQLYTVNDQLVADQDGTLARLAAMGIRQVEAFAFVDRAGALAESFAKHGMQARTGHAPLASTEIRRGDTVLPVPPIGDVFAAAKTLGMEYVIDPFVPIERWLDAEQIEATAARLNEAGKQAAEHGLKVGYHNHAQEFAADIDGVNGYEYFASLLDDDVILELDLFWAATAGQDLVALLGRLGDKVKALHIKDGVPGENPFVLGAPMLDKSTLDQRPAGQGEVPLLDSLAASPSTELAVIEFDYVPGDIFDAVQGSVDFLHSNGVQ